MAGSLKDKNVWAIRAFVGFNGVLFCAVVHLSPSDLEVIHIAARAGMAGVTVLLATALNYSLTADAKSKLVYLRRAHVLPGHRAFTLLGPRDPRVDAAALEAYLGKALPSEPVEQNQLWYRWSKRVEDRDSVSHAHRMSLLFRDLTALAALFAIVFAPAALCFERSSNVALYVAFLVALFVLLRHVAVNTGERFVTTVLAEVSARPPV